MAEKENDVLYFISFVIEHYKMYKGMSGSETMKLFDKYGVTDYLAQNYDVLHTQSAQWMLQDVENLINSKRI